MNPRHDRIDIGARSSLPAHPSLRYKALCLRCLYAMGTVKGVAIFSVVGLVAAITMGFVQLGPTDSTRELCQALRPGDLLSSATERAGQLRAAQVTIEFILNGVRLVGPRDEQYERSICQVASRAARITTAEYRRERFP